MPPANYDKNLILDLYRQGVKQAAIAKSLGCSKQYISQTIKLTEDPEWRERYLTKRRAKGVRAYRRKNPGAKEYRPRPREAAYRHYPGDPYDPRSKPRRVRQSPAEGYMPVPVCLDSPPGSPHQPVGLRLGEGAGIADDGSVPCPAGPVLPG